MASALWPPKACGAATTMYARASLKLYDRVRDRNLEFPGRPILAVVCRGLLVGRREHPISGVPGQAAVAARARSGTGEDRCLIDLRPQSTNSFRTLTNNWCCGSASL